MDGILTNEQRIAAFSALGKFLAGPDQPLDIAITMAAAENSWFTNEHITQALRSIAGMLNPADLSSWFATEFSSLNKAAVNGQSPAPASKSVGLVLAGNIPLVGFHDILCVLASGNRAMIKLSSHDKRLIPFVLEKLVEMEPGFAGTFTFIDRLAGFDAVIATGSTNTSRYFEYYFRNVPHIIRKNRNSAGILKGNETVEELQLLGHDIFDYFGLGCRSVSTLYVPEGYDFTGFFEAIEPFAEIGNHHKYHNNYDYNKSIFLINAVKHLDNGFLLLSQDERLASPLAVLHYEEYSDISSLKEKLGMREEIQCIVSSNPLPGQAEHVRFGESQHPALWDYADNINTAAFLTSLH